MRDLNSTPSLGHRSAKTPRLERAQGMKELQEKNEREENEEKGQEPVERREEA